MGLDLTWRYKDRIKHGKCGKDLETVVHFRLPESSGFSNGGISVSTERDSRYVLFHPDVLYLDNIEIPEGETGYALEYTSMDKPLTSQEVEMRLREHYAKDLPEQFSLDEKEEYVEAMLHSRLHSPFSNIGTAFVAGIVITNGQAEMPVKQFIRWVDKEEFDKKAKEAKKREGEGEKDAWVDDKWYGQLDYKQREAICATCPLNTDISTNKNNAGCYRGASYSHISSFLEYISDFGAFPLLKEQLQSDGEFEVEDFPRLADELSKAKEILETTRVHAMNLYDADGTLLSLVTNDTGRLYGNEIHGYGVGLEGNEEAISVVFKGESVFDLSLEQRKEIFDTSGLEGIMAANSNMREQQSRMYFTEIRAEGDTFFGTTRNGQVVELPPYEESNPFNGYGKGVAKMEFTTAPATEAFGYVVSVLNKYLDIGQQFTIPIEGA